MMKILDDLNGCLAHLDDILIMARTKEEHDKRLNEVMKRLEQHNVRVNLNKSEFGVNQIKYLGHLKSENGIQSDPAKVESLISTKSTPVTKKNFNLGLMHCSFMQNIWKIWRKKPALCLNC